MTTPKPIRSPGGPDANEPLSPAEKLEKDALVAGFAAAGALRAVEVAAVVLLAAVLTVPHRIVADVRRRHAGP